MRVQSCGTFDIRVRERVGPLSRSPVQATKSAWQPGYGAIGRGELLREDCLFGHACATQHSEYGVIPLVTRVLIEDVVGLAGQWKLHGPGRGVYIRVLDSDVPIQLILAD